MPSKAWKSETHGQGHQNDHPSPANITQRPDSHPDVVQAIAHLGWTPGPDDAVVVVWNPTCAYLRGTWY